MSVNELQALTQKFADAFDQRDLQPVMEMLSEDVEVFDHVPYRFDGKPLFAKYLHEAVAGLVSASFGFRQPSCRVYGDTVGIVNAYDMFTGVTKDGEARSIHGRTTFGLPQTERAVEDCQRPLLCYALGALRIRRDHPARLEMEHDYQ
jgi:ketosteroid isomerase-like protein